MAEVATTTLVVTRKAAKKDDKPSISVPEIAPKLEQIASIKAQQKDLQAKLDMLQAEVTGTLDAKRVEFCRAKGEYIGSIKVNGQSFVTYHNSQKNYSEDELAHIKEQFGPLFETYFRDQFTIVVDVTKLDADTQAKLAAAGAECSVATRAVKQLEADRSLNETLAVVCANCGIKPIAYVR